MSNYFLKEIFSGKNTNIIFSNEISVENQVINIISDIKSEKDTHIELLYFFSSFDKYQEIQTQKKALYKNFENNTDAIKNLNIKENTLRVDILNLCLVLNKIEYTEKIDEIKSLIKIGAISKADYVLDEKYLKEKEAFIEQYEENKKNIKETSDRLVDSSNEFMVKASLVILKFELENRYEEAENCLENSLKAAKYSKVIDQIILCQNEIGNYYLLHNKFDKSIQTFSESIDLYEGISNKENYLNDISLTYIGYTNALLQNNQINDVDKIFNEAQSLFSSYNNNQLNENFVYFLFNYLFFLTNKKKYTQAKDTFNKISNFIEKRVDYKNEANDIVIKFLFTGSYYFTQIKDYEKAEKGFLKILQIYKSNYIKDDYFSSRIIYNEIANYYIEINELKKAKHILEEGIKEIEKILNKNPQKFIPELAITQSNYSIVLYRLNLLDEAERILNIATVFLEELSKEQISAYETFLGKNYNLLSSIYRRKDKLELSKKYIELSINIKQKYAKEDEVFFSEELLTSELNLGNYYSRNNEIDKAIKQYYFVLDKLNIYGVNKNIEKEVIVLRNIGECYVKQQDFFSAKHIYYDGLKKIKANLNLIQNQIQEAYYYTDLIGLYYGLKQYRKSLIYIKQLKKSNLYKKLYLKEIHGNIPQNLRTLIMLYRFMSKIMKVKICLSKMRKKTHNRVGRE